MTPRERILTCLRGGTPDMVPMRDAPLPWAIRRWEKEGLRPGGFPDDLFENCIDGSGVYDSSLRLPEAVLEDDGYTRVIRGPNGITARIIPDENSTPHVLDWPAHSRADWDRLKTRLTPSADRLNLDGIRWLKGIGEKKFAWCCVTVDGLFGSLGIAGDTAEALMLLLTEPDWVKDIFATYTDFNLRMLEMVRQAGVRLDGIYYNDDIAYKNGPMFSPAVFRDLFLPELSRLFGYVHGFGGHVFYHTDGLVNQLIPGFIEAGVDILDPLEFKAGVDLAEIKRQFGRKLLWEGNINAMVLYHGSRADIEREVRRVLSLFPEGGYIYRTDGPITQEASFDNYRWLLDCVKKYGRYG